MLRCAHNSTCSLTFLTRSPTDFDSHVSPFVLIQKRYAYVYSPSITGNETTAQTMAYMFRELSRHPEAQDRLREELAAFQGEPNYDDYQNKLPYLDAVIKET